MKNEASIWALPVCLRFGLWIWALPVDEAQAGIKIARRNISNLRYTDDTTLTVESEELKILKLKYTISNRKKLTFKKLRSWHLVP